MREIPDIAVDFIAYRIAAAKVNTTTGGEITVLAH